MKLREFSDADRAEMHTGPTENATEANTHPLHCSVCGGLYYVDDRMLEKVLAATEGDATENVFCCDDCIEEAASEER